jgi:hypothetical protein
MGAHPFERTLQKRGGALLLFIRKDFSVGEPCGVVDRDVDKVEAGAAGARLSFTIPANAVADLVETA